MDDASLAFGAESVIDEIVVLEAALRKTAGRPRTNAQPLSARSNLLSPRYNSSADRLLGNDHNGRLKHFGESSDAAQMVYGLELKAWIDMQVDRRVKNAHHGVIESKLSALEEDTAALKSSQARLVTVAQDLSDEFAQLKLRFDRDSGSLERLSHRVEEVRLGAFSKDQGVLVLERIALQETALAELRGQHDGFRDLHTRDISTLTDTCNEHKHSIAESHRLIIEAHERHERQERNITETQKKHLQMSHDLRDISSSFEKSKQEQRQVIQKLKDISESLQRSRQEAGDLGAVLEEFKRNTVSWRSEIKIELNNEASRTAALTTDLEELQGKVVIALKEMHIGLEDLRNDLGTDLAVMQKQFPEQRNAMAKELNGRLQEMHKEMSAAFKGEAAAVASVEQHFRKTRRELEQRMDDIQQSHQECITAVSERRFRCNPPAESSSNTVISPRISPRHRD